MDMDPSLFPVDDVSVTDPVVWPTSAMNRSSSEWAFQRFLDDVLKPEDSDNRIFQHHSSNTNSNNNSDEVVEIANPHHLTGSSSSASAPTNPDDYHAALKRQLDLACAAVALSRKASVSPEPAASGTGPAIPTASLPVHGGSVASGAPKSSSSTQPKDWGTVDFAVSNEKPKLPAVQVKSSTSGSSRDQSEDDELDGEAETNENMGRTDDKRARRMLSNRESARRSRRRKQEHMSELETQAAQLRVEHSSLLKNLNESTQKYTEASVNLRVLKADVETLRAKVMMAEEKVKRLTGVNTLQPFPDVPQVNMPFNGNLLTSIPSSMLPGTNHLIHLPTAAPTYNSSSPKQGP